MGHFATRDASMTLARFPLARRVQINVGRERLEDTRAFPRGREFVTRLAHGKQAGRGARTVFNRLISFIQKHLGHGRCS